MTLAAAARSGPAADALAVATALAADFAGSAAARDRERRVPAAELARLDRSGLLALTIPVGLGGAGLGAVELAEVIRVLATADASIAQVLQNHFVFVRTFLRYGTTDQRRRLAAAVVGGARFGNALSERGGPRTGGLATRLVATAEPGRWELTGVKHYATGALTARIVPVLARRDDDTPVVAFVDRDAPGLTVVDDWSSIGQRGTHSGTVRLDRVRVHDTDVIAPPTDPARAGCDGAFGQLIHVAIDVGLAQGALAAAVEWVRTRARAYVDSPAGRAAEDPHVLAEVGRLEIAMRSARALLAEGARRVDEAGPEPAAAAAAEASVAVAAAKVTASTAAVRVADELFALAGASATDERHGLDRWWRDARVHTLHDPDRYKLHHLGNWVLNGVRPVGPLI